MMEILIPLIPNEWLVSNVVCSTPSMGPTEGKEHNICWRCIVVPFLEAWPTVIDGAWWHHGFQVWFAGTCGILWPFSRLHPWDSMCSPIIWRWPWLKKSWQQNPTARRLWASSLTSAAVAGNLSPLRIFPSTEYILILSTPYMVPKWTNPIHSNTWPGLLWVWLSVGRWDYVLPCSLRLDTHEKHGTSLRGG